MEPNGNARGLLDSVLAEDVPAGKPRGDAALQVQGEGATRTRRLNTGREAGLRERGVYTGAENAGTRTERSKHSVLVLRDRERRCPALQQYFGAESQQAATENATRLRDQRGRDRRKRAGEA